MASRPHIGSAKSKKRRNRMKSLPHIMEPIVIELNNREKEREQREQKEKEKEQKDIKDKDKDKETIKDVTIENLKIQKRSKRSVATRSFKSAKEFIYSSNSESKGGGGSIKEELDETRHFVVRSPRTGRIRNKSSQNKPKVGQKKTVSSLKLNRKLN